MMKGKVFILNVIATIFFAGCASRKPAIRQDFQKPVGLVYNAPPAELKESTRGEKLDPNIIIMDVFEDEDVNQVLANIKEVDGVPPITFIDDVSGTVTIDAENGLQLQKVLELIAIQAGCVFRLKGGTIFVYGKDSKALIEPEIVPTFRKAEDIFKLFDFDKELQKYLKVIGDTKTSHQLFVSAPPSAREEIDKFLRVVNIPPKTILMEVIVWIVSEDWMREVGTGLLSNIGVQVKAEWSFGDITKLLGTHGYSLNEILKLTSTKGKAKIWTRKTIAALEGECVESKILGKEHFKLAGDDNHYYSYQIKEIPANSYETLCPHILEDLIMLDYDVQSSIKGKKNADNLPEVFDRQAKGPVLVKNGELAFIANMQGESEEYVSQGWPGLSWFPLLGSKGKSYKTVEFWIGVRTQIVDDIKINMERKEGKE